MKGPMTVEDELWKRAFWSVVFFLFFDVGGNSLTLLHIRVLVSIDRGVSSGLGRPCAVHDEECVFSYFFPRLLA